MSSKVYQIVTDRILAELAKGVVPWLKPWRNDGSLPTNLVSKKPYRGANLFLLPREYPTNYFVSFRQCKGLGGRVRKGERAHLVVFWKFLKQTDQETGEPTGRDIPMLRYYNVFNVDQCEGLDLSKIPEVELSDIPTLDRCEATVDGMPNPPEIKEGDAFACYYPAIDMVNMPQRGLFKSSESYYKTLFHELVHSTGHESRLDRMTDRISYARGSQDYSREELVAEMGAAFLAGQCGIDTEEETKQSASYIDSWRRKISEDPKLVVTAAGRAQKAADYILDAKAPEAPQAPAKAPEQPKPAPAENPEAGHDQQLTLFA